MLPLLEAEKLETPEQTERRIFMMFADDARKVAEMTLSDLAEMPVKDEAYVGEMIGAADAVIRAWQEIRTKLSRIQDKASAKSAEAADAP